MPHGWAIAEFQLLLRDALAFEDGDKLVLLGGVPPAWFTDHDGMKVENLPTHFGSASLAWSVKERQAALTFSGSAAPPGGFVLRLPPELKTKLTADGKAVAGKGGDFALPTGVRQAQIEWTQP